MSRVAIAVVVGTTIALVGMALWLEAHELATRWESLGPSAWGGETDLRTRDTYQVMGGALVVFGAAINLLAAWRWLGDPHSSFERRGPAHISSRDR